MRILVLLPLLIVLGGCSKSEQFMVGDSVRVAPISGGVHEGFFVSETEDTITLAIYWNWMEISPKSEFQFADIIFRRPDKKIEELEARSFKKSELKFVGNFNHYYEQSSTQTKSKKLTARLDKLTEWAERGDAKAQYHLGLMSQDDKEKFKWYRKAAEQGHADAQTALGMVYLYGEGIAEDQAEAVKWFRKAAEQGDFSAKSFLEGFVKWYRNAAEQGDADAQFNLGWAYSNGEGVAEDDEEAVKWYRKAAGQGHAEAKKALKLLESE